ncbi:hypothetical protein DFP72DRAFT_565582 [Ephemerocybe angulata]|uniref:Secreted protein n=1 Tax=Ephemerocybe angulata TaxID=980116 RepID=A0A8H6ICV0_9AGAR|nr:hypothetical protein DFP72DRAFT_565582 [Tulosesus angulatus]
MASSASLSIRLSTLLCISFRTGNAIRISSSSYKHLPALLGDEECCILCYALSVRPVGAAQDWTLWAFLPQTLAPMNGDILLLTALDRRIEGYRRLQLGTSSG